MVKAKSDNGKVEVYEIQGSVDKVIKDLGLLILKVLLIVASAGTRPKGEICVKYGLLTMNLKRWREIVAL